MDEYNMKDAANQYPEDKQSDILNVNGQEETAADERETVTVTAGPEECKSRKNVCGHNGGAADSRLKMLLVTVIILLVAVLVEGFINRGRRETINIERTKSDWAKLMLVLENVDKEYVDKIDHSKVTEEILPVIMSKLDPHSVYLPPVELEEADTELQGGFDGIGIQFTVPNDTAIVSNVIVGGPSEKAGLLSGDRIIKVDTTVIAGVGMPQDSMMRRMRGKKGTRVRISVMRAGEKELVPFDITRDKIPVYSVDAAFMVNDTTGYLKLSKFTATSYYEVLKAAVELREQGMRRLVFDLRDNTGGYLDQALKISNEFLEKGNLIVYTEGRACPREECHADGKGSMKDISLAILINEGSASSSEIFAGAMQDNDRATLYGVRSFGKGLVQAPIYFSDGSGIRLTIARYHTPTGRCIQKPYTDDYEYDILERYAHGEMVSADSIKVNDSLKYTTPGGRVLYGGGGIIPDVFVPLDTSAVTDFLVKCNRQGLQIKYANKVADSHRAQMRGINDMASLNKFLDALDIKDGFISFTSSKGLTPTKEDWEISGSFITTQLRALIGRYTAMDDKAFYPIYLTIDKTAQAAIQGNQQ